MPCLQLRLGNHLSQLTGAFTYLYERIVRYALKFGVVGIVGFVVDVSIFNGLRLGVLGDEHFFQGPLGAKIVSATISTLVAWFGNRYWTFREHRRQNFMLELLEFGGIAIVGIGISLGCLYISHYLMGLDNLVADNISTNIIGLGLATTFRFLMYRFWVYGPHRKDGLTARMDRVRAAADSREESEAASYRAARPE